MWVCKKCNSILSISCTRKAKNEVQIKAESTHRAVDTEDVTVVFVCRKISCYISKHGEVIGVLTCAENVSDFMFAYNLLLKTNDTGRFYRTKRLTAVPQNIKLLLHDDKCTRSHIKTE